MDSRYLISRLLQSVLVLFIVTLMTFFFMNILPGDPVTLMISPDTASSLTPEDLDRLRAHYGLDRPVPIQYVTWLGNLVTGDWGLSIRTREPVLSALLDRLPVTLQLAAFGVVISYAISIPAGIIAAVKRNSLADRAATVVAVAGVATPNFWFAILLIILFSARLGWLPASGYVAIQDDVVRWAKHLVLPAVVLGTAQTASLMRQTRSSMLEVLRQDYVRTAQAKGLSRRVVILRHALRNALIPVVTIMGFQLGNLVGGTVIIEQMFALPGMGRLAVQAIFAHDYPVVMGFVLMIAFTVQIANLLTDVSYGIIDPRIRLGNAS